MQDMQYMQNFGGYTLEIWTFRRGRMREDSNSIHLGELYGTSLGLWPMLLIVISHVFKS